jgi:hypothetical protein
MSRRTVSRRTMTATSARIYGKRIAENARKKKAEKQNEAQTT